MELDIVFESNIKGFIRDVDQFVGLAYLKKYSCYPINHTPITKNLFNFLVKYSSRRQYDFTFEEPHPFGIFDRDSAIKVSKCFLKIENRLFCVDENLEIIENSCNIDCETRAHGFVFIDNFIRYLTDISKQLLEEQYNKNNFEKDEDYVCKFAFCIEVEEKISIPWDELIYRNLDFIDNSDYYEDRGWYDEEYE